MGTVLLLLYPLNQLILLRVGVPKVLRGYSMLSIPDMFSLVFQIYFVSESSQHVRSLSLR